MKIRKILLVAVGAICLSLSYNTKGNVSVNASEEIDLEQAINESNVLHGGNYVVNDSFIVSKNLTIPENEDVQIRLNSYTITDNVNNGLMFRINGSLTIEATSGCIDCKNKATFAKVFDGGTLSIDNVCITNCNGSNGGAIHNAGYTTIKSSIIEKCSASAGGGIYNSGENTKLSLINTELRNNKAENGKGGAIAVEGTNINVLMDGGSIHDNLALQGGGMYVSEGNGGGIDESGNTILGAKVTFGKDAKIIDNKAAVVQVKSNGDTFRSMSLLESSNLEIDGISYVRVSVNDDYTDSMKIGVRASNTGAISDALADSNVVKCFVSDDPYKTISIKKSKLYIKATTNIAGTATIFTSADGISYIMISFLLGAVISFLITYFALKKKHA